VDGFSDENRRMESAALDSELVASEMARLEIETPSWGFGDSGTRFKIFEWPGAARNIYEKIEDAALVHRLTGVCPRVAIHIPWDYVDDFAKLKNYAAEQGIGIGAVNPNLFQDDMYKLGSLCHPSEKVRNAAIAHVKECIDIAKEVGSSVISLWLADGTNYAGQDSIRERKHRLEESLSEIYRNMPEDMRLLIEYKFFEPAFYHTDLPDWGTAYIMSIKLGDRAQVLVDLGHHAQGTNIEQIVSTLIDERKLGGFHFNNRKYADDDLIVGSINPFELFCIFAELRWGIEDPQRAETTRRVAFMLDQSHNIESKIEAMLISVENIQIAHAKAWLIDKEKLEQAQQQGDVLGAHRVVAEAFNTDVRPILRDFRKRKGLPEDPIDEYRKGGYEQVRATSRRK